MARCGVVVSSRFAPYCSSRGASLQRSNCFPEEPTEIARSLQTVKMIWASSNRYIR